MDDWTEVDKIWEQAYSNGSGELIYAEDTYGEGQTELDDFHDDRYEVRHRSAYRPEDVVLDTVEDLPEDIL